MVKNLKIQSPQTRRNHCQPSNSLQMRRSGDLLSTVIDSDLLSPVSFNGICFLKKAREELSENTPTSSTFTRLVCQLHSENIEQTIVLPSKSYFWKRNWSQIRVKKGKFVVGEFCFFFPKNKLCNFEWMNIKN